CVEVKSTTIKDAAMNIGRIIFITIYYFEVT
ncbi:MAG: hypothetical protein ACJAZI_001253, partial [Cycloclasticus sp.]